MENNVNRPQEMGAWVLINVDWYDDPGSVGEVDLIFLGVKLYDAADAVKALLPMLGPDTGIITLQNGIEAPKIYPIFENMANSLSTYYFHIQD